MKPFLSLILLSGGKGRRMQNQTPKQYLPLKGKIIAWHSLEFFLKSRLFSEIIIVCANHDQKLFGVFQNKKTLKPSSKNRLVFAAAGAERQLSVFSGLKKVSSSSDLVLIHDSARPFISKKALAKLIQSGLKTGAAALGAPVKNTIKKVKNGQVIKTLKRDELYEIYTPQAIRPELLKKAFKKLKANQKVTDDVSLIELLKHPVTIVEDTTFNLKITTPLDLEIAEKICPNTN
ncbi:MAG: 2-C-methyl-D-erythritol 4-phosphate cytidylyltransferase [Parachlamydiales bacterium]|jgi:2-C-methyl-D-erythritol 4-phosphate cytidylyltransferase